jgi:hypothetical protein
MNAIFHKSIASKDFTPLAHREFITFALHRLEIVQSYHQSLWQGRALKHLAEKNWKLFLN